MNSNFIFNSLEESHLGLLCEWFSKPHVKEWWNDNLTEEEIKSKYSARIGSSTILPFIAYLEDNPIGFIQYYHANKIGDDWWQSEMDGTVGIDQFIGEETYINCGYGTQMIGQFLEKLFSDNKIKKVITDVDGNNHRAIRCYEKLGFCFSHKVSTPEGVVNLMSRYQNTSIEPHAYLLKKPDENTTLNKIISLKNFTDMVENDYLYFRRVDTCPDDKRDSDQPTLDKKISEQSKFENTLDYTAKNYYDSCRSKTYACCFSTENTSYLWKNYGESDPNAICMILDAHKLINFLNLNYHESTLIYKNSELPNFLFINYGLVTYGDLNNLFLKKNLPNPIEYVYFKDASRYAEEKELRISLSCIGICKYKLQDGTEFEFPDSLKLSFNFLQAINMGVIKQIQIHDQQNNKEEIKSNLSKIFNKKGINLNFS